MRLIVQRWNPIPINPELNDDSVFLVGAVVLMDGDREIDRRDLWLYRLDPGSYEGMEQPFALAFHDHCGRSDGDVIRGLLADLQRERIV